MYGMGTEHGWHWFGGPVMILFWAMVIICLIVIVRRVVAKGSTGRWEKTEDGALEILKKRYARGEINREDFERMRDDLNDGR